MLREIDRVILQVPGVESAVRYYRDTLKLVLIKQDAHVASFKLGACGELVLHDNPDLPYEEVYFRVDDVRALYQKRAELKLSFVQSPQQIARGYKAAIKDPFGTVLSILDRSTEKSGGKAIEDGGGTAAGLFPGTEPDVPVKRDALMEAYVEIGRTADDLPYTPHFEQLYQTYSKQFAQSKPTRRETWRHLLNLRKAGKLPKLGDARTPPPQAEPEAIETLKRLIGKGIGRRDRLPYTDEFEALVDRFNKTQARPMSPHLVWRLVAKLAK